MRVEGGRVQRGEIGDVGDARDAVDRAGHLFGSRFVDVDDRDPRALRGHTPARGRSDAGCATGDERALTVEEAHRGQATRAAGRPIRGDALS